MSDGVVVERPGFEIVPHWLLFHEDVTATALRLYLVLRSHADNDSGECWPSRQRLAGLMGVSLRTLDAARRNLVECGAVCMARRALPSGGETSTLYHVHYSEHAGTCSDIAQVQELTPLRGQRVAEVAEAPLQEVLHELIPIELTTTGTSYLPPDSGVDVFGRPLPVEPEAESDAKRAQRLTKVYTQRVPLSKFPAVMGIVRKAMGAGYDDEQIAEALAQLADEGRPVTVDTLRIQMEGFVPYARVSRSEQKTAEVVSLVAGAHLRDLEREAAARDAARDRKGVTA